MKKLLMLLVVLFAITGVSMAAQPRPPHHPVHRPVHHRHHHHVVHHRPAHRPIHH